jgi:hypothetical protein
MTKDRAKKGTQELAELQKAPRGIDSNITQDDLILPRLELTQALSPSVVTGDAKPGVLLNSVDKSEFGKEMSIIPVILRKHYIRWIPRNEGGGMLWKSDNPADPRVIEETKFGPNGEKPLATAYLNFLCLVEGQEMPIVVSFSNTSYTAGRRLLTMAKMQGGDLFSRSYKLSAKPKTNNKGTFFVLEVGEGQLTTKEDYARAERLYNAFASRDIKFESENEQIVPASTSTEKAEY